MPRTYKAKLGAKRRRQYCQGRLAEAIAAVQSGMTQRAAAREFRVPRGTLQDKVRGKHRKTLGGQCVFTDAEETVIAQNIAVLGDWGFPLTILELRLMVRAYLEARGRTVSKFNNNTPGEIWITNFIRRRRDIISQRHCQNICRKRAEISPDCVDQYFNNLATTIRDV